MPFKKVKSLKRRERAKNFVEVLDGASKAELYAMMSTILEYMENEFFVSKLDAISNVIFHEIIE